MTEQSTEAEPKEVWQTLSEQEKKTCMYFAHPAWQIGVRKDYWEEMGVSEKDIEGLQKRNILEVKPGWQFYQEFVDEHKAEVEKIRRRLNDDPLTAKTSDIENGLLNEYRIYEEVANRKNEAPRYRLTDKDFYKYINDRFGGKQQP